MWASDEIQEGSKIRQRMLWVTAAQILHLRAEGMRQAIPHSTGPVLVVENDLPLRQWLAAAIEEAGYAVAQASNLEQARMENRRSRFSAVVCDLELEDGDALDLLRDFQQVQPAAPFIVMVPFGAMASAMEALRLGALDYLEKPSRSSGEVKRAIQRAVVLASQQAGEGGEQDGPRPTPGLCGSMVARDPRMLHVLDLLGKVAPTAAHVMLIGETGTGKEVIARCIHLHSRRAARPFIAIHCSALAPVLVESELFGHERGAFPGAVARRLGALERAHGGTVFLDGIGELSPSVQSKLLRALRERSYQRIGSTQPLGTDIRIISATDHDLDSEARNGHFDPELLGLLGAFPMEVPPLRDRPADIDALAAQFLAAAAAKFDKPQLRLSEAVRFQLRSYSWPGNVRELENAIERAAILSDGEILPDHLPFAPPQTVDPGASGTLNVHELERKAIEEALRRHGGNRTRAARELGISLRTLQYRLKEFGLSRP